MMRRLQRKIRLRLKSLSVRRRPKQRKKPTKIARKKRRKSKRQPLDSRKAPKSKRRCRMSSAIYSKISVWERQALAQRE